MLASITKSNDQSLYTTSYAPLQNLQATQSSFFQSITGMEAIVPSDSGMSNDSYQDMSESPYLKLIVKPCDRFRFRYKSESGSHGKLRGAERSKAKSNFPTVQLHNFNSCGKIEIRASLYTDEPYPKPHVLQLVGKNCSNGTCSEFLLEDNTAIFRFLEIESKKKEELYNSLYQKNYELLGDDLDEEELQKSVQKEIKSLNMNVAILCFEAFQRNNPICPKLFSGPIRNLKSVSSDLRITRLSSASGRCSGGEDVILLCDKINKDDIKIRFYEKNGGTWEGNGAFNKCDVHHQVAIAFKTPAYNQNIEATVYIELYRPSDSQSGEPVAFCYIPDEISTLRHSKKRKLDIRESAVDLQNSLQSIHTLNLNTEQCEANQELQQSSPGTSSDSEDQWSPISENDNDPFDIGITELLKNLTEAGFLFIDPDQPIENFIEPVLDTNLSHLVNDPDQPIENSIEPVLDTNLSHINNYMYVTTDRSDSFMDAIDFLPSTTVPDKPSIQTLLYILAKCESKFSNSSNTEQFQTKLDRVPVGEMMYPTTLQDDSKDSQLLDSDTIQAEMAVGMDHFTTKTYVNLHKQVDQSQKDSKGKQSSGKESAMASFELFKRGTIEILRNRKTDDFLRYLSSLMTVQDENGNFLLHLAIMEQNENINLIAKILDMAKMSVNKENKFKETPLHLAVKSNNWNVVLLLLAYGGNLAMKNQDGDNCLHLASRYNHINSMKLLLLRKLKEGNPIACIDDFNYDGFTPIHLSVLNKSKECMQLLLQAGANVNIPDRKTGRSPLHFAYEEQPSLVYCLLSQPGINPESKDLSGNTPFESMWKAKGNCGMEKVREAIFSDCSDTAMKEKMLSFLLRQNQKRESKELDGYDSNTSDSESDEDIDDVQTVQDTCHDNNTLNGISYISCEEEDKTLNEERLCEFLDANGDWRKLGKSIGFDESKLNCVARLSKNSSPTKSILRTLKKYYPDVLTSKETLINILSGADLNDAIIALGNLSI